MLITTGKVNDGVIRVDTKGLPDGTMVTVLAHEGDETFELNPTQEAELLAAIAEAERGGGLLSEIKAPVKRPRERHPPIKIKGEPLSETVIEERR